MNPGANLDTSVVGPLEILVALVRRQIGQGLPENLPELEEPCPICILTKATKIYRGPTTDVSKFAWLYALLLHTPLDSHPEVSDHLLIS